jgi:hypothetical protein
MEYNLQVPAVRAINDSELDLVSGGLFGPIIAAWNKVLYDAAKTECAQDPTCKGVIHQ